MADYYDQFSVGTDFPEKAANEFIEIIDAISNCDSARIAPDILKAIGFDGKPDEFEDWIDENEFYGLGDLKTDYGDGVLYFYNDAQTVSQEGMTRILSAVMKKHDVEKPVVIPVSYWCSKPRTDGFGGGVWVVGPDRVDYTDTRTVGEKMAKEMMDEKRTEKPKGPRM